MNILSIPATFRTCASWNRHQSEIILKNYFLFWKNISERQDYFMHNWHENNHINIIMDFLFHTRNIFNNKTKTNKIIEILKKYKQNGCCVNCFKISKNLRSEKMCKLRPNSYHFRSRRLFYITQSSESLPIKNRTVWGRYWTFQQKWKAILLTFTKWVNRALWFSFEVCKFKI